MSKIVLFQNEENCSGCGACAAACPKQAIEMVPDSLGYLYPVIADEKCIGCGKCTGVCSQRSLILQAPIAACAAVGKQDEIVQNSASGGVFATLAHSVLEHGGLVSGAVMDCTQKGVDVYHILSDSKADIARMQGSKYVQSDALRCYQDICRAVKEGKNVLFSGTPCQTAAVKQLTGDPENLITMDVICHGVPPVQMLNDYIKLLGRRLGGRIEDFRFRDKSSPKPFTACIQVKKGKKCRNYYIRSRFLSVYQLFLDGAIYRESCHHCPYACGKRGTDLTVGDYWGIEKFHGEDMQAGKMPERKDWSCILANTEKGLNFLKQNEKRLLCFPTRAEWVAAGNRQLTKPSEKHPKREHILQTYQSKGYVAVEREFIRNNGGVARFYWRMLRELRCQKGKIKGK